MAELYAAMEPYLAAAGLSALTFGTVFLSAFAALKWFGERWVTAKFGERLEAFKHAQQREIEQLKFQINASMDRAVKLHQREFETLPQAWSTLVSAYNAVNGFTSPLQSYAAVGRMSDAELDEFLADTEFTNLQKNEIRQSRERDEVYQKAVFWLRLNKVMAEFRTHHDFISKNAIFMPAKMKAQFAALGDLVWDALIEHKVKEEYKTYGERPKRDRLEAEGNKMLAALEADVQQRLWSDVQIK